VGKLTFLHLRHRIRSGKITGEVTLEWPAFGLAMGLRVFEVAPPAKGSPTVPLDGGALTLG